MAAVAERKNWAWRAAGDRLNIQAILKNSLEDANDHLAGRANYFCKSKETDRIAKEISLSSEGGEGGAGQGCHGEVRAEGVQGR